MPEHGSSQFNVLVIMSDQHSRFHLGCYEDGLVRTPHLDRLAAEGIRFTNAYCASPICVPRRCRLLERIHAGWDPDLVLKESEVLDRDMQLIANWGKAAQPLHEDNWPVPDVEDVVFR